MTPSLPARACCLVAVASLLSGCAATPGNNLAAQRDPLENVNRGIYKFNRGLDKTVVTPATRVYRAATPRAAQRGIANFFNNVDEPWSFINALAQGKLRQAGRTLARFTINTVLGVGGLADHASEFGLIEEPEDLGQTLAVWGMKSGPYVMLPFFGPSTLRDSIGFSIERFADPYRVVVGEAELGTIEAIGVTGLELVDTRSYVMDTADALLKGSADEYATVRAAYLQLRQNAIYDGAPPDEEDVALPPAESPGTVPDSSTPDATPAITPDSSTPDATPAIMPDSSTPDATPAITPVADHAPGTDTPDNPE